MAATPTIVIGRNNWGVKNGNLLGYYQSDDNFFVKREFTVTRGGGTNGTFVGSNGFIQTAASGNIPRISYLGGSPRLLVEASGTNGILNSENTATNWTLGANITSGYVDVIGVSGNNLTVAVSGSGIGSAAGRLARFSNNVALASGSTYTISFLMKKTGTHTIGGYFASITGAAAGELGGGFNVSGSFSSGVVYDTAGTTNRIRRIELWGTDVYRCSETFTMTASGTLTAFILGPVVGVTLSTNPAVGLGIAFAAPQIELGALPTSFIPTTTASVTRNTDSVTITGATDYIGQTEGTIYLETDALVSGSSDLFCFARATANTISISKNSSNIIQATVYTSGPSQALNIAASGTVSGNLKIAVAYKTGDSALYINGVQIGTSSTAFSFTAALTQININPTGSFEGNGNQRISALSIYNKRLSNQELIEITS
jgi:hypothetical protein